MKIKKFSIATNQDDEYEKILDCVLEHTNTSNLTAKQVRSIFSISTIDGFILEGGEYTDKVDLATGDSYEFNPYARAPRDAFGDESKVVIKAKTSFYAQSPDNILSIPVPLSPGLVEKYTSDLCIDNSQYKLKCMNFIEMNGKSVTVRSKISLAGSVELPPKSVEIKACILNEAGLSLDESDHLIPQNDIPGVLTWENSVFNIKKKDFKSPMLTISLATFSLIDGSEDSISQEISA